MPTLSNEIIKKQAPGKLYIAGEYAVVEVEQPAILMAVNQFIYVSVQENSHRGSIKTYDNAPIGFYRKAGRLVLDYRDDKLAYVVMSIKVVEALASELAKPLKFFDLIVESELENVDGLKYGLGSSAAVTVSTISALCELYQINISKLALFKLAAIVHHKIKSNGSGGDLAAIIYGGIIVYERYDQAWLKAALSKNKLNDLISVEWPYLNIKRLNKPNDLTILIGWTSEPASTTLLVERLNENKYLHQSAYNEFLRNSKNVVNDLVEAFESANYNKIFENIKLSRKLLNELSSNLKFEIETASLTNLVESSLKYQAVAKSSGAGGGDCGLAFLKNNLNASEIIDTWQQLGITYLDLEIYSED